MDEGRHPTFVREVAVEIRRLFRYPWTDLSPVVLNACVVTVGWVLLPLTWRSWLFDNFQGRLAFVIVLQLWMLCDVNSTNHLGNDPDGALEALRTKTLARRLRVQIAALAVVIGAIPAVLALIITVPRGGVERGLLLVPILLCAPVAMPSVACLLGALIPLRDRGWLWRWRYRLNLHEHLRWIVLGLALPYPVVSTIAGIYLFLCRRGADVLTGHALMHHGPPPPLTLAVSSGIAIAVTALAWWLGPLLAARVAQWNQPRLVPYLTSSHQPPADT